MKIIILKNKGSLATRAANLVIKQIKKKKSSVLALPTGSTPLGMYKKLRLAYKKRKVNFSRVITFNLDEYVGLRHSDKNSYYNFMHKNFFNHVNMQSKNIHIPDGVISNLKKEARDYERKVSKAKIDLAIIGIGHNGHIAFNEPGSGFNSKTRVVNLSPETRRANARFYKNIREVPKQAITMGIYTIMQAKKIILLVSGKDKAEIIAKALKGKPNNKIPASYLQLHPKLTVILDKQSAREL